MVQMQAEFNSCTEHALSMQSRKNQAPIALKTGLHCERGKARFITLDTEDRKVSGTSKQDLGLLPVYRTWVIPEEEYYKTGSILVALLHIVPQAPMSDLNSKYPLARKSGDCVAPNARVSKPEHPNEPNRHD
jgi:hypothetical protein